MIAQICKKARSADLYLIIGLAALLFSGGPACSQALGNTPPDLVALETAGAQNDQSAEVLTQLAVEFDDQNGQANAAPPLVLDKYQKAAGADENAEGRYEAAEKSWNEAADRYKAAADAIKGFNDSEATQLAKSSTDTRKKADLSRQNAIKAYLVAAVEHDKAAARSASPVDKASETVAAAKDRDAAAHVK